MKPRSEQVTAGDCILFLEMLLPDIPAILPSPAEAVEQYPLVRYVPWRADHSDQPDWEDSDLLDHEIESWNACCEICRDDYTAPDLKNETSLLEEPPEPLRKLPCEHAYHVSQTANSSCDINDPFTDHTPSKYVLTSGLA